MTNGLNSKEVIIVFPFDPSRVRDRASGNPANYLYFTEYLLKHKIRVTLLGMQIDKQTYFNRNFKFIPIFNQQKEWYLYVLKLFFRIPFVKTSKGSIIISSHPLYLLPVILFKRKNPIVFESIFVNNQVIKQTNPRLYHMVKFVHGFIEPFLVKNVDTIIVSPRYKEDYLLKYPWISNKIFEMTHESVDTELFNIMDNLETRKAYGFSEKDKIVLQVALIHKVKRNELLIKSFYHVKKQIPEAKLIFVGPITDKKYKEQLDKLIEKLNLSKEIKFMGEYPLKDIPKFINCANLLAVTSTAETGPLPAIESFACGIPIVSTNVGLVPILIKDNKLGRLVPIDINETDFAEEIVDLLLQENIDELKIKRRNIAKEFEVEICQSKRLEACELAFYRKLNKTAKN